MAFGASSKYIGSQKTVASNVITADAQSRTSWLDNGSIDLRTAGALYAAWTRTLAGGATAVHSDSDWSTALNADTAPNDAVTLISKTGPKYAGGSSSINVKMRINISVAAPAQSLFYAGFSNAAGTIKARVENTALDTVRLVCANGGAATNGTPFEYGGGYLEIRIYYAAGNPSYCEVWAPNLTTGVLEKKDTITSNVPGSGALYAFIYIKNVAANINATLEDVCVYTIPS